MLTLMFTEMLMVKCHKRERRINTHLNLGALEVRSQDDQSNQKMMGKEAGGERVHQGNQVHQLLVNREEEITTRFEVEIIVTIQLMISKVMASAQTRLRIK